jgi:hypothetical protein
LVLRDNPFIVPARSLPVSRIARNPDMAKKKILPKDEGNRLLIQHGYFYGLKKILEEYDLSKEVAAKLKARLFEHILVKVSEAKKEIAKLQDGVERLEAACRAGMVVQPAEGHQAFSPAVNRLVGEMQPFDGWVISLLESDISLLATINNPETAGVRVNGLKESFANLWNLRMPGRNPFGNAPDVFDMSVVLPS